jgi:hypothetical protein
VRPTAEDLSDYRLKLGRKIMNSKINPKVEKAKTILGRYAKRTSYDLGHELLEIPRNISGQLVGKDKPASSDRGEIPTSSIVEAMQQKTEDAKVNPVSVSVKRAEEIENDMLRLREKRKQLHEAWSEQQASKMEAEQSVEPGKPLVIPTSRPSRGTAFKRGHGGQKSPETRKSKH